MAGAGGIAFAICLVIGFTFFGPRGGFYAASAVEAFVSESSPSIAASIYLFAIATLGLIVLMAYLSETYLSRSWHQGLAWGTSLLSAVSVVVGWGLYFAPSVALSSGGPGIDPAISYAFTSAGMVVLFGVGGLFLGMALLTVAIAGRESPMWVRGFNGLVGIAAFASLGFILTSRWSPNQWLPVPFYLITLWGLAVGVWLLISSPAPPSIQGDPQ